MFYSPSARGFYLREIHGDNIPEDCLEISLEEHAALLDGQSKGKEIVPDETGKPVLADPQKIVPGYVSAKQIRLALLKRNLLDDVEQLFKSDRALEIDWTYATTFLRDGPVVTGMATAFNMSEQDLDDFFSEAHTF